MMAKKLMSLVLALVMCLSLCVPASASLETTDFTTQELEEINITNKKIEDALAVQASPRMIDQGSLPMTAIKQENGYYCGPATCCMVANTMGLGSYSQSRMAGIIGTTRDGSSSSGILSGMNSLFSQAGKSQRYQLTNTRNSSLASGIIYSINAGLPLILSVKQMPLYTSSGHFIAVCAYRSGFSGSSSVNEATICDSHPKYYGKYTYNISTLESACNSNAGNFLRIA